MPLSTVLRAISVLHVRRTLSSDLLSRVSATADGCRPRSPRTLSSRFDWLPGVVLLFLSAFLFGGCGYEERLEQPPYVEVVELSGTPYEMGVQHGAHFSSKIRSFYTQLLSTALLPWLNRERPDIAGVVPEYAKPLYDNGQFSYQVMLQSGENLLQDMPKAYQDELQGVADGSGFPFEQVLVLNTLLDSMLNMRVITYLIRLIQAPQLLGVQFIVPAGSLAGQEASGDPAAGGRLVPTEPDVDGPAPADTAVAGFALDEEASDEEVKVATIWPYNPSPHASVVEIPVYAKVRFTLEDLDGVDPQSLRLQLNRQTILAGDPSIQTRIAGKDGKRLVVDFTPPGGFQPASVVSLQIQAGDLTWVTNPPPGHARIMRDERIIFTTAGYGKKKWEVENRGELDDRTQPPPLGFALRNSATVTGQTMAAHHFALLDSGTSHRHNAVMIRRPKGPKGEKAGKPHVMIGWAGILYGFSGMNSDGLVWMANVSDSLNNSMAGKALEALQQGGFAELKLLASGILIGIEGREILTRKGNVREALEFIAEQPQNIGWNMLLAEGNLADRGQTRTLAAAEVDSDILKDRDKGFLPYVPDPACSAAANCDPWGRPWASVGPDDLRMAAHFQRNTEDIEISLFGFPFIEPQRFWSTYYYRSLRGFYLLGDQIKTHYGKLDLAQVMAIMRISDFVDRRDSMNAVIYEPERMRLHYAAGQVPATDGPFVTLDLSSLLAD